MPNHSRNFNNSIQYWNDPVLQKENPELELPSERITVVVRSDKAGQSLIFTEFMQHSNPETWPDEAVGQKPVWPLLNNTDVCEASASITCKVNSTSPLNLKADGQTGVGISLLRNRFSIGYMWLGYFATLTNFIAQAHVSNPTNQNDYQPASVQTLKVAMDGLSNELDPLDLLLNMVAQDTPLGGYPISRSTGSSSEARMNLRAVHKPGFFTVFLSGHIRIHWLLILFYNMDG